MDDMVKNNRDNFRAYLIRAYFRLAFDDNDLKARKMTQANPINGVKDDLSEAKKRAPEEPEVIVLDAALLRSENKLPEARKVLRAGIKAHPKEVGAYLELIALEVGDKNYKAAMNVVQEGLKTLPDNGEL
jgi:hypothetical protein